jgi:thiamine-phosphate pyrophosphorylase
MATKPEPFRLCLVTDDRREPGELLRLIAAAVAGGVDAVMLRERRLLGRALFELASAAAEIVRGRAALLVNDRVDVALAVAGAGAHLPESGLPLLEARSLLVGRLVGRSAHGLEAASAAERGGADYVIFGPVYETPSKRAYGPPLGLERLRAAARLSIPVYAVGGIVPQRAAEVRAAGAAGMAAMSYILDRDDPGRAAAALLRAWEGAAPDSAR